jgi:type I restriction enzyme, S subunit
VDESKASADFVEAASWSTEVRGQLASHIKTAAGQHGISGADLKTIRLPMPDLATQQAELKIQRDAADTAASEAVRALSLLDRLEQGILARAFRGHQRSACGAGTTIKSV